MEKINYNLIPKDSENYNLKEIAKIINFSNIENLRYHLKSKSILFKKDYFLWTQEEIDLLKELYPYTKAKDLLNIFPKRNFYAIQKQAGILKIVSDSSIKNRIYFFNENYFEIPNLENSYWAGFIAADGSIKGSKNGQLSININIKDEILLKQFKNDINHPGNLFYFSKKDKFHYIGIDVYSKKFTIFLENNFNIVNNKTFILKPPQNLNFQQSLAFIKGLIDGDGSIQISTNGRISIRALGTEEMLLWVKNIFDNITPDNNDSNVVKHKSIFSYTISKKSRVKIIGNLLKQSIAHRGLERKWNKII